jgi:hypothetical protein
VKYPPRLIRAYVRFHLRRWVRFFRRRRPM